MTAQAMMRVRFKRPRGFNQQGVIAREQLKDLIVYRLTMALRDFQQSILNTPVYTGRTLVNYRWAIGAPEQTTRAAVKDPPRPGKTSEMSLGSEPRRQANAAVVQQEFELVLASVRSNPFVRIFLNNNVEHFSDVEFGTYADDEGQVSRTPPGGMTRRGETLLEYDMMGYLRRVT